MRTRGGYAAQGLLGVVVLTRSFSSRLLPPAPDRRPFRLQAQESYVTGGAGLCARRVDQSLSNREAYLWKLVAALATVLPSSRPSPPLNSLHLGAAKHLDQPGHYEGLNFYHYRAF